MTVTSPTSATAAKNATGTAATSSASQVNTSLGSADFLKLLTIQFQQQDPMKPMDDTAFISQMAQFTSLQQTSSLVTEVGQLNTQQQTLNANSMLGLSVTATDAKGQPVTGTVTGISNTSDGPQLMIGGTSYPMSSVQTVQFPTADTPSQTPSS